MGKADDLLKRLQGLTEGLRLKSYSHGAIAALLSVVNTLDVPAIINHPVKSPRPYRAEKPVRNNLTAGSTLLLGAMGRVCMPTGKINQKKLDEMEGELGLRVLMTDRHDWDTVAIIKAYYGQSMIEHAFRNLKNPYPLALKPQFHWTDQKIKVHFFMGVLGYLLASIVWHQAKVHAQFKGTLDTLNNIRLAAVLEETKTRGRVKTTYTLEEMSDEENLIMNALGIKDVHNNRLKFQGVRVYS